MKSGRRWLGRKGIGRAGAISLIAGALVGSCGDDPRGTEGGDDGIGPGGTGSTGCTSSLDCVGAPNGRTICDVQTGNCVECTAEADCDQGETCAGNICRSACDSDNDCTPLGLLCDFAAGHCVSCLEDAHCPERSNCQAGNCVPETGDGGAGPGGAAGDAGTGATSGSGGAGGTNATGGDGGTGATGGDGRAGSAAGRGGGGGAAGGRAGSGGTAADTGGSNSSTTGPSCTTTGNECHGESCCTSLSVPGGTFRFGRFAETCSNCTTGCPSTSTCAGDETPEHGATIASFVLDKYEVTVGRFRRFVQAYSGTPPADGAGAMPTVANSGWQASWNASLTADAAALSTALTMCEPSNQCTAAGACDTYTWTPSAGANELLPINCATWYEAFAFCIWDGGRLPSEAEFEYASGGNQNLVYPWGNEPPPDLNHAVYSCLLDGTAGCSGLADVPAVGSRPAGAGPFGHLDLLGSMSEWVLDFFGNYPNMNCTGCVNLTDRGSRVRRGSGWYNDTEKLRTAARIDGGPASVRRAGAGFRCAREP